MCKTGHEHAANEKTHKPRVHTRHDNMKARSQDIHKCMQPIETRTACNTTKHTWTRVRGAERTRDRALTQWQKMERECPNPVTETKDMSAGIQTPHSNMKQGTQTRERATRAHSKPRAHMKTRTWWEYQGSVTKPWITLDRSDRTLTVACWFSRGQRSRRPNYRSWPFEGHVTAMEDSP